MCTYVAISGERCVARHQEMQLWRWNQWSGQTNQIVIHIGWITKGCGADRHDS